MDVQTAREAVVAAGLKLVESGLIARTWGNVSCRIDDKRFVITPSGLAYESLKPEDIVVVGIDDLEYEGDIKPSSEKGVHAQVYKLKPHIQFVIHTHQTNASVAGILGRDVEIAAETAKSLIGSRAVLADYGLPGTKKLQNNVTKALSRSDSRAVLMRNHGALCFGESSEVAFDVAMALEEECSRLVAAAHNTNSAGLGFSCRKDGLCVFNKGDTKVQIEILTGKAINNKPISAEAALHLAVYRVRRDINVIKGSVLPYTQSASGAKVKPLLDDFAQIIGVSVRSVQWDQSDASKFRVVGALSGRNAVLLSGFGALCCAGTEDDATAVEMILEKGCMTHLSAAAAHRLKPIAFVECLLMRKVYQLKYSKKSQQKQ